MKKQCKENFTKLTQKRGISLIILIVTIIVIIILAAAVILTLSKNNPIESARETRFKEDIATMQDELSMYLSSRYTKELGTFDSSEVDLEDERMVEVLQSTDEYKTKVKVSKGKLVYTGEDEKESIYFKEVLGETGDVVVPSNVPEEWQATIAEVTKDGIPIPKGFTYVEGTKDTGVVIKDENDNEFVWVPATESTYVKDLTFPGDAEPTRDDTLPSGIADETSDVKKYGGFYIGRYEAGIPKGDTAPTNKTGIPVSKKGAIVWSDIDYTNAKISAESMIRNDYVQTGLLTGKAWDTTCHWIEDYITTLNENSSLTNSVYYGNYFDSLAPANVTGYGSKQVAGFSDKWSVKNIYDLAGNIAEWTTEGSNDKRFFRGGFFDESECEPICYRFIYDPSISDEFIGFRTRLYIK